MSEKPYSYREVNYRLICYKGTIYKFKVEFSGCDAGKNRTQGILTPSEADQVKRTIGVLVHQKCRRAKLISALQTTDFLFRCSEKPWKIGKKVGFRLRGEELAVPDFMFLLNVKPKQKRATAVNGGVLPRERPRTDSRGEPQRHGAAQNNVVEKQPSTSRQYPESRDREQEPSTDQCQKAKAAQELEPRSRMLRSNSRQQRETPPRQMQRISRLSPRVSRKSPKLSRNEKSPRQMQKRSDEVSPRRVRRKSPRLLLSEKSPTQLQRSSEISPRESRTTAKLSEQEKSLRQGKRHPEVSPGTLRRSPRFSPVRSDQSSPMKSPGKRGTTAKLSEQEKSPRQGKRHPEVSPGNLRKSPRFSPVRSDQSSPMKSPGKRGILEVYPRVLHKNSRLRPARSNQSNPLKSPERHGVPDHLPPHPSKPRRGDSVGSDDDTVVKRLRSNSAKLSMSDVTATEKLLHPLDKEFVRREFEHEESRLRNLAKPSMSSAERKAWASGL